MNWTDEPFLNTSLRSGAPRYSLVERCRPEADPEEHHSRNAGIITASNKLIRRVHDPALRPVRGGVLIPPLELPEMRRQTRRIDTLNDDAHHQRRRLAKPVAPYEQGRVPYLKQGTRHRSDYRSSNEYAWKLEQTQEAQP
jgi:hypothetical protein